MSRVDTDISDIFSQTLDLLGPEPEPETDKRGRPTAQAVFGETLESLGIPTGPERIPVEEPPLIEEPKPTLPDFAVFDENLQKLYAFEPPEPAPRKTVEDYQEELDFALLTMQDEKFVSAETDEDRLDRFNELRRQADLDELEALPPDLQEKGFLQKLDQAFVAGLSQTSLGLLNTILGGQPTVPSPKDKGFRILSEIVSIAADPATYAGFGVGGAVGRQVLKKVGQKFVGRMAARSVTTGVGLAALTGVREPLGQVAATGKLRPIQAAKEIGKAGVLGLAAGAAGAVPRAGLPLEIGAFAAGGAALEARKPTLDDLINATGVILGLRLTGYVTKLGKALFREMQGEELAKAEKQVLKEVPAAKRQQILQEAIKRTEETARPEAAREQPPPEAPRPQPTAAEAAPVPAVPDLEPRIRQLRRGGMSEAAARRQAATERATEVEKFVKGAEEAGIRGVREAIRKRRPQPPAAEREASVVVPTTVAKQTVPSPISKKALRARTEAGKALDELGRYLSGRTFANPLADPELLKRVGDLATKSVRAGVYTFADFVQNVSRRLGFEATARIGPALKAEWEQHRKGFPLLDEAGDVDAILNIVGKRIAPIGRAPGLTELPRVDEASSATPLDLVDQWHGDRDVAMTEASIDASKLQDRVKRLAGIKHYGKKAQDLDQAIHLYVDLKGKAEEQFAKWGSKLSPEQVRSYGRSQNLSPDELVLAEEIRQQNDKYGRQAKEADVIGNVLENYTARLWETPKERRRSIFRAFQTKTPRARHRTLESILHGWALGKQLQVTGATNAQLAARTEIARVIADRNLIALGAKGGLLSDQQHEGWKRIEHPNFRKWQWVGKVEEGKTYGRNVFLAPDGNIYQRAELFAEPVLADHLNKALGRSAFADISEVEFATKWNSIIKQTILTTALFHHQAFLRSSMLGSKSIRGMNSYQQGKQAVLNYTQELRDLVRAGLTLGRVQDWEESYSRQRTAIGAVIDRVPIAAQAKEKLLEMRDRQTNFLFKKMGAYMKAQAAILEYHDLLQKHADKIESGERTRHHYAGVAARLANDDFGGLHLERMGRNPTVQHVFRLLALAPDWTESNVRSAAKAFPRGEEAAVYKAFWGRVLLRGLGATALFNLMLAALDDKDFLQRYKRAWKEGNLRWLEIDVTPIHRRLGGTSEKRKYFSFIGHFRDPLKFVLHPIRSAKHKGSVLSRFVLDAVFGTDWSGRPFTTFAELIGLDDKGEYTRTVRGKYEKGQPKGGKLKGALVRKARGGRPLEYGQYPSFLLYQARSSLPIPMQQGMGWLAGELDGFDALTKSVGMMTSTTYPPQSPERAIEVAVENEDRQAALAALDRLIAEQEPEERDARATYLGKMVYRLTEKDGDERALKILRFLDFGYRDLRSAFMTYWRQRGNRPASDAYYDRMRRLRRLEGVS